jgi:hypothetical protein
VDRLDARAVAPPPPGHGAASLVELALDLPGDRPFQAHELPPKCCHPGQQLRLAHSRFGSIDQFIAAHSRPSRSLGLAMIGGLNVLNGGSKTSGIPGRREGKFAMSADELRSWGRRFLTDPDICGFLMYQYDSVYLARPDIQAALAELGEIARDIPKKDCRP